jgi:hypothetical protein
MAESRSAVPVYLLASISDTAWSIKLARLRL